MLTLSRRNAKLHPDHSGKTKEKDGLVTKTLKFGIEEFTLDETELNALLGDAFAYNALYNIRQDGVAEPMLRTLKALELDGEIEGAFVKVFLGVEGFDGGESDLTVAECTLSGIKLTLRVGGETWLSCKVTCAPALDASLAELVDKMGSACDFEIRGEPPGQQQDLPLNTHGTGEQAESMGAH